MEIKSERAPYEYQPISDEIVPPGKKFYHGTQITLTDLAKAEPGGGSELNIYGPGLYLTDNPK